MQRKEEEIKHFKNISLTSLRNRPHFGKAIANYLILNELVNAADGMETSKRRDCDHIRRQENFGYQFDGMETSKRRDCDVRVFLLQLFCCPHKDGMETSKRRDCDSFRYL